MTNFLNRLAGRALGITAIAQPIIPARFDPTAERSGWPKGSAIDRMGPSMESDSSITAQAAFRIYESEPFPRVTTRFREHLLPFAQDEHVPHARLPSDLHPSAITEMHSPRHRLQEMTNSTTLPYTGQKQHAAHANVESMSSQQETTQSGILSVEVRKDSRLHDERGVFGDLVHNAVPGSINNQAKNPVRSPMFGQSSSSPVIRVTIGRIDVRAELASSPAPTVRRPRTSTLSLDQYLKPRGEVGR
jgi:hypothetical protein